MKETLWLAGFLSCIHVAAPIILKTVLQSDPCLSLHKWQTWGAKRLDKNECKAQTTHGLSVLIHMQLLSQSCHTERLTFSTCTGQPGITLGFSSN